MKLKLLCLTFIFISSCKEKHVPAEKEKLLNEYSVGAVLWQQQSAEHRALSYQAFNLGKLRLDQLLKGHSSLDKPMAIITDIDETIFDNSPFNGKLIQTNKSYSREGWIAWGKAEKATAIPGALDFLNYAVENGVTIFYVSNRLDEQKAETIKNMVKLGFPGVDKDHILLRTDTSGKEARRKLVSQNHEIVLLFGDNLTDFSKVYDSQGTERRNQLTDSLQLEFGYKFIVLPNPIYGDWETKGIYEGSYDWTPTQKDSIRQAKIKSY